MNDTFQKYAWNKFRRNKPAFISLCLLVFLAIVSILSPILSIDQPLYVKYKGKIYFPAISFMKSDSLYDHTFNKWETIQFDITDWKQMKLESVIWPPIVYSPGKSDLLNHGCVSPFGIQKFKDSDGKVIEMPLRFYHWLGTNKRGEDVLSGLIHGSYISLSIGILSMGIASIIGVLLGSIAGYFGDSKLFTKRGVYLSMIPGIMLSIFYGFVVRKYTIYDSLSNSYLLFFYEIFISLIIFFSILFLFYFLGKIISNYSLFGLNTLIHFPVDSLVCRLIEILISMPRLILIISIAAIAKPSIFILMIIIGTTSWTNIARITRGEFLRVRNLDYITAAQSLGFNEFRIIFKHALPNAIAPVLVTVAFGVASAILTESGLSFLGVGVPAEVVTWGALVNSGRENFSAWWLVIFPGFAIFITVTIYNLLGEGLRDAIDPRLKI